MFVPVADILLVCRVFALYKQNKKGVAHLLLIINGNSDSVFIVGLFISALWLSKYVKLNIDGDNPER